MIKIAKMFFALIVLYYGWFQYIYFKVPNMLFILGTLMLCFICMHAIRNRVNLSVCLPIEFILWLLFALTSLFFGILVTRNPTFLLDSIFTFVQFLLLIFGIVYISVQIKSVDFFMKVLIIFSIVCALTTLIKGVDYGLGRISMAINHNPNSLGITMAIGVCSVLYRMNIKNLVQSFLSFSIIFLLVYIALLSGSRKSFLSIVIIVIYWFIFVAFKEIGLLRLVDKLKGVFLIGVIVCLGAIIIVPLFKDSVLFLRLSSLIESGDATREGMYKEAFDMFAKNPFIGVGFNNFRLISSYGTYSHSTYAEVLACTGFVGTSLYLSSYITLFAKYLSLSTDNSIESYVHKKAKVLIGLFGVLLFLGVGVIHFYEMTSSIAFGLLFAYFSINKKSQASANS